MNHQVARARCRLEELTFGTFYGRALAVKCANGMGRVESLLVHCAAKGRGAIGLEETKLDGTFENVVAGYRVLQRRLQRGPRAVRAIRVLDWR